MATLAQGDLTHTHHPNIVHVSKNLIMSESPSEETLVMNKNSYAPDCIRDECEPSLMEETLVDRQEQEEPIIDISINNVVCSFNVRSHLNLRQIALTGYNVEYKREHGMLTMKLRHPYTTASFWSSGKVTCTGATSEDEAKIAARKFTRIIQKLGFKVRFSNFRVVNVLGTCSMPFGIRITQFSENHRTNASYEPELHPGVTYKIKELKATLKIFSTGSITVTAPSVGNVQEAIVHIFPMVYEYRKELPKRNPAPTAEPLVKSLKLNNARNKSLVKLENNDLSNDDNDELHIADSDGGEFWD